MAYVTGADKRDPHAGTLRVVDMATRKVHELKWGFDGMVHLVHWESNDQVLVGASEGVHTTLVRFSLEGVQFYATDKDGKTADSWKSLPLGTTHRTVVAGRAFSVLEDKSLLMVASTPNHPNELFHHDNKLQSHTP